MKLNLSVLRDAVLISDEMDFLSALKIVSADLMRKNDAGEVNLDLKSRAQMSET